MSNELVAGVPKDIRRCLKMEWLYAYQMYDPQKIAIRIIDARLKKGQCQVKSHGGIWFTPDTIFRRVRN